MVKKFKDLLAEIENSQNELQDIIRYDLQYEWKRIIKQIYNALRKSPTSKAFKKMLTFWREKVKVKSQIYRRTTMSKILEISLFGNVYKKMRPFELVKSTKNCIYFHISSAK